MSGMREPHKCRETQSYVASLEPLEVLLGFARVSVETCGCSECFQALAQKLTYQCTVLRISSLRIVTSTD